MSKPCFDLAHATFGDSVFVVDLDGGELALNVVVRSAVDCMRDEIWSVESATAHDGAGWRAATTAEIGFAQQWVDANEDTLRKWWESDRVECRTVSDRSRRLVSGQTAVSVFLSFVARCWDAADERAWSRRLSRERLCGELLEYSRAAGRDGRVAEVV